MRGKKNPAKQVQNVRKSTAIAKKKQDKEIELAEKKALYTKLKDEIHKLSDNFVTVVIDLQRIKAEGLWKFEVGADGNPRYENFEEYMIAEFDFRRAYFSRLTKAYRGYHWLEKKNPDLQKQLPLRPLIYETLSDIQEEQRMDSLNGMLEEIKEGKEKPTAAALTRAHEAKYGSKESETPEEIERKKYEKTFQILFGILKGIDEDKLKKQDLPIPSDDLIKLKGIIKLLNDKIQKCKTDKAD